MRIIVTDKLARRQRNFRVMITIEMPCCGAAAHLDQLTDEVGCETCGVVLDLVDPVAEGLALAA